MKTSGKSWAKYIDGKKRARKSGYRKSKVTGEKYYEDRPNHSDEDPKTRLAHGGMTEHGLEVGDKITGNFGNLIGGYNKDERERFVTDLDKGKRTSSRYAKGGLVRGDVFKVTQPNHTVSGRTFTFIEMDGEYIKAKKYPNKTGNAPIIGIRDIEEDGVEKVSKAELNKGAKMRVERNIMLRKSGENYYAKGGKTKKGKQDPPIVRGYFEDEPYEYGGGGAIYKGDKVKIKGSNKTMVVKNIAKGKKGYVEFTGDAGTYLKGDLEKFEEGGMTSGWCYSIGGL